MTGASRSPNYPRVALGKAVDYVRTVYQKAHTAKLDSPTLFKVMGFAGKSGASAGVVGALRKFGLLEGRGDSLRVSGLALKILEPENAKERRDALKESALTPEVYKEIMEYFERKIPASEVMRSYLVRSKGFTSQGADHFIKIYLDTVAFAGLDQKEEQYEIDPQVLPEENINLISDSQVISPAISREVVKQKFDNEDERIECRISPEARASVLFYGPVTQTAISKLIAFLELSKDNYPIA